MPPATIRLAAPADVMAINSIHNYYVVHSTCTYQTEPSTLQQRHDWFSAHGAEYPIIVVEEAGEVVGWGSLSQFHPRSAYRPTVENSIYLRHDCLGRGLGRMLLEDLIRRGQAIGHHSIIALISGEQAASIRLHKHVGFVSVAHLKEVGRKFDQWLDVVYMQKMLRNG